jgi:signal transduction histidine kinase
VARGGSLAAGEFKQAQLGIITTPDVARLPPGGAKTTLDTFGVRAWACVGLRRPGWARGILGFDRLQPAPRGAYSPREAVRLAGDAIANALEREIGEREKAKLTARLERALRLQLVGQLASGVAHNFNNIVSAILGYSEMASSEVEPGGKAARRIAEIEKAAEQGRDLVDGILTRRRSDARSSFVLASQCWWYSLLLASLPSAWVDIRRRARRSCVVRRAGAIAADHCQHAGTRRRRWEEDRGTSMCRRAQHHDRPCLQCRRTGARVYARIAVSDDGPGFSEEAGKRLFEPFSTRPAGTGLGLATVRKIVRDHDGAIDVASAPGKAAASRSGCRRQTDAPTTASKTQSRRRAARSRRNRAHRSRRSRHLPSDEEILAALGYEPIGFDRPADAIAAVRSEPGRFDAVLICVAPLGNALDLAHTLHAISPGRPILRDLRSTTGVDVLVRARVADLAPNSSALNSRRCSRCLASAKRLETAAHDNARAKSAKQTTGVAIGRCQSSDRSIPKG